MQEYEQTFKADRRDYYI